ncbi:putative protein phosphatase 2C 27 isoform X1 [Canna indica]|uniref:protein-serine/threonine phosphatase n=1 Tax=Canna indica TaxID=4628 RepID=A0AAQ3KC66_9LILI|nr:putative protein phosphatase 2C 27 isoform X1 [Canna indica]
MAAGTEFSSPLTMLEGKHESEQNGSSTTGGNEDRETSEGMKDAKVGKPPRQLPIVRHSMSSARLELDLGTLALISPQAGQKAFLPVYRSGSFSEIGPKTYMEDEHICIDNLVQHLGPSANFRSPGAFYGVFDGHGGRDAAFFVRNNILKFIIEDSHFPDSVMMAIKSAFIKVDHAFADSCSLDHSSGTTALTALILGRSMLVANAGDCRAVLGKRGRAIELSRDHKPSCNIERLRIEELGGSVFDGCLNGQLYVARALGDWHMKGSKGSACPLSAEPELQETLLTEEDEFLIMSCDGLWDVMSSQCAVTIARKELMVHNDPEKCARELVREALKRNTCDNVTVMIICFSSDPPPRIEIPRARSRRSISLEGLHLLQGALDDNIDAC